MFSKRKMALRQDGFILAAVLWVLACMFIAVGFFHAYVERKKAIAIEAKAQVQSRLDMHSTEQTLLYLLATSRFTLAGMSFTPLSADLVGDDDSSYLQPVGDELRLDGVTYRGIGNTYFSLQDNAGLLSLNSLDHEPLEKFFRRMGAGGIDYSRLIAAKVDYIDSDDNEIFSGAERASYTAKNLPPPANDFLRTPEELSRILGWQTYLNSLSITDYHTLFSSRRFGLMNLNAMPKELLINYLGLNENIANNLVQERITNPLRSGDDFLSRTGGQVRIDTELFRYVASKNISLWFWRDGGGQARLISLQLSPNGLPGPWLVDYEYSIEPPENDSEPLVIRQPPLFNPALGDGAQ